MTNFSSTPISISQKLLALMLFSVLAVAQSQAPAALQGDNTVTTIKTRTQLVLLDVVATDHSGRPVTDLKREDFTVLERGQKQQLASFDLVDVAKRPALPAGGMSPKLPPGVYSSHLAAAAQQGDLTVLLLDALNTPWADQAYARYEMLKYLKKNHQAGQRIAIYGLNTTLRRLQDFTDDPEVLRKAIDKHRGGTSPISAESSEPQSSTEGMSDQTAASVAAFEEEQAAFQTDMRVRMTLDSLKAIGRQLSGYPGRKKLIWVSGSFPIDLAPGENSGFNSQRFYADDITATTSLLRDSQVSVYPIDAKGLSNTTLMSASESGRMRNGRLMTGPQALAEMSRRNALANAAQFAARKIADDTGGLAFYNRNDLDTAVMKSMADGAIYYALSYSPDDKNWDGRFRKIEVKVNRPGLQLRYRKGYLAVDPNNVVGQSNASITEDIGPALTGFLTASGISFYGSAQPLADKKTIADSAKPGADASVPGKVAADISFLVEPRDIFFQLTNEGKRHCNIQFVLGVFVADKFVDSSERRLNADLEPASYKRLQEEGLIFRMHAMVPVGKSRLRLLVRDNQTGKMGSLDIPYPNELAAK
jgi:VWFA-related protein